MTYRQLPFEQFGSELLKRRDIEPVYEMLFQSRLKGEMLHKWLIAFWLFQNAGVASDIAESPNYYEALESAGINLSRNQTYPQVLLSRPKPEAVIDQITNDHWFKTYKNAKEVLKVEDYAAYRIAVMIERCLRVDMDFSGDWLWFFNEPRTGALTVYEEFNLKNSWLKKGRGGRIHGQLQDRVEAARNFALGLFENRPALPDCRRVIGTPEIATIFAKYKQHRVNQYHIGKATQFLIAQLSGHGGLSEELKQGII